MEVPDHYQADGSIRQDACDNCQFKDEYVYLKDNKCSIYADRPEICRINSVYNKEEMSLAEWHYKNAEICNKFIEEDGLDESFKINLSKILHHVSDNS